jgi:hypothetical protein
MPMECETIRNVIKTNHKNLTEFIINFQNDREDGDFTLLKNRMREILDELVWYR